MFGVEKPHRSAAGSGLLVALAVGVLTFFSDVVLLSVTYSISLLVVDSILLGAALREVLPGKPPEPAKPLVHAHQRQ